MSEFKLSRLRFTWLGEWTTGTFYNRDAIVLHEGKTYVCLVPHTASDFYDALAELPIAYWDLQAEGKSWAGEWYPSTAYSLGNIVHFGGATYYCSTQHTSASAFAADETKWGLIATSDNWKDTWAVSTNYGLGDIVRYGGNLYRCIDNHVSATTTTLGLEYDAVYWEAYRTGIEYRGTWSSNSSYKINELVKLGSEVWKCTTTHPASLSFNASNFTVFFTGARYSGTVWSGATAYNVGDLISYGAYDYINTLPNNIGNIPSPDSAYWELVNKGISSEGDWSNTVVYKAGSIVKRGAQTFVAITNNSGTDPLSSTIEATYEPTGSSGTTVKLSGTYIVSIVVGQILLGTGFNKGQTVVKVEDDGETITINEPPDSTPSGNITLIGVSYGSWAVLTPAVRWRSFWSIGTSYLPGDLVLWQNATYRCIQDHSSLATNSPVYDSSNTYWVVYLLHARNNASNTVGDITTFNVNQYEAIGIGPEEYSLRATNSLPSWRFINRLSNVYYVSEHGTDAPTNGVTLDRPWRTIKYACDRLLAGTINQNAAYLLKANKEFIVKEMYEWMLYQVFYETPPFTSVSVFDQAKTLRDARLVIDAIVYDITRGGNSQTVAATLAYFATSTTFINSASAAQMPYFIAALEYLTELAELVLTNTAPTFNYQLINSVPNAILQVINTNYRSETGSVTLADASETILTNVGNGAYTINTRNNPIINLVRGNTYEFTLNVTGSHPTWIQTQGGAYNTAYVYNDGVLGNGANNGATLTFIVPFDAPDTLFYQCQFHSMMYGQINVYDATSPIIEVDPALTTVSELFGVLTTALTDASTADVPLPNSNLTATIFVKTGTYNEVLPITIPENVAINGDELRGVTIKPATTYSTITASSASNKFNVISTDGLTANMPIQFAGTTFGGVTAGTTYYVVGSSITPTAFSVSTLPNAVALTLSTTTGSMTIYAGECLKDMFYMRNGSGLRNVTLNGLLGTLTAENEFQTRRPTGGAYVSLDPGIGPDDTSAWIFRRSPYAQNVTLFGQGCTGLKVDGTLHNGGNKSIVANDFTTILSDGIGAWVTGSDAKSELISVFSYYAYAGYFAEAGGRIRAANGNSSYGTFGVVAEGFDPTETPLTGNVLNRSTQVQASIQSSLGLDAQLLKLQYSNAGKGYDVPTTNLLKYSNNFLNAAWTTDSNINFQQNVIAPSTYSEAWTLTALTDTAGTAYIEQAISVTPAGSAYAALAGTNISGSGTGATFDVTITGQNAYSVIVNAASLGGSGYVVGNQIRILGSVLGGINTVNDLIITVAGLSSSSISAITQTGVVPTGSSRPYLVSVYLKQGTAPTADIYAKFSGSSAVSSKLNFNFNTGIATPSIATPLAGTLAGSLSTTYGVIPLDDDWYRVWFTTWDKIGLNNALTVRVYPAGYATRTAGVYSYVYGSQIQSDISSIQLGFYLETTSNTYTSYANYQITGSGSGAEIQSDEIRSGAVFETRVVGGGGGYLTASNNAQGGNSSYVILAGSDNGTASNYLGMRVFINSGTGTGQYGYVSSYNSSTKIAWVLKESFDNLTITSTSASTNEFTVGTGDINQLYVNQKVQFIPTYYNLTVTNASRGSTTVTSTVGGLTNKLVATTTAYLQLYMPVVFSGNTFGSITSGFVYYVASIDANGTDFQVSTSQFGTVWGITTASGSMSLSFPTNTGYLTGSTTNMSVNMPITFGGSIFGGVATATTYYVNNIYDSTTFGISSSLVTVSATDTTSGTGAITVSSTSTLTTFNPIVFSGTTFGNILAGTTYYVNKILAGGTTFTVADSLLTRTTTATIGVSDLIYVNSTTGFVANAPITFTGTSFGGIVAGTTYYILAINDGVSFTISTTLGGGSVNLSDGKGALIVKTASADKTLVTATGTMTGTTTTPKILGTSATGSMTATISTSTFGGASTGTTYYVLSVGTGVFTLTATSGGVTPVTLTTATGSMSLAAEGWDHIIPGTPIQSALDSSSLYFIEPKIQFSDPGFSQVSTTLVSQGSNTYTAATYGNGYFIAIASASPTAAISTDGTNWTSLALPGSDTWIDIAYGNGYWVIVSGDTQYAYYSSSNGYGWRRSTLPSSSGWLHIVYGNGKFVAITPSGTSGSVAASSDNGASWSSGSMPFGAPYAWTNLVYGGGKFVAIASGSGQAAYSINGTSWTACTLPRAGDWTDIAYGNGRFVAITTTTGKSAYSLDGITWYESNLEVTAIKIAYGEGVFLLLYPGQTLGYTSEDGINWKQRTVSGLNYNGVTFGYVSSTKDGIFVTASGVSSGSIISAGTRTKGRPVITSNIITSINEWEPGSNYTTVPTITFTDPNNTSDATLVPRLGNGTLGNPTIIDKGEGYSLNSTYIRITGNGYSDAYQTGYTLIANNLTRIPSPGDNLTIAGIDQIFKVTNATVMFGTVAPNIEANIQVSPDITADISAEDGTVISIRQKYSQARLTGHDLLNIGYGNFEDSNYPSVPTDTELKPQNQTVEINFGRVFYTTGDQDGNFKVGNLFGVQQATGIVTLSATQFGLSGLDTLSLGGIAVGGSSVIISQFSTDATLAANSDNIIPTQKAIKSYITSRLSQGGSNTFTGNLIAGNISVGNPNFITNLVPAGIAGSSIEMPKKIVVSGASGAWAGGGAALQMFAGSWARRGNVKPGR
jgi:hypothetical protein